MLVEGGVQAVRGGVALAQRGVALADEAMFGASRAAMSETTSQLAIRQRVLANIAESQQARAASKFGQHAMRERVLSNVNASRAATSSPEFAFGEHAMRERVLANINKTKLATQASTFESYAAQEALSARAAAPITDPRRLLPAPSGTNPWMEGSVPVSMPAPPGTRTQMAMAPGQVRPGGWGTLDHIPDVAYVRNELAVTPQFKPDIGFVQDFEVPAGTQLQIGIVDPQSMNGLHFPGGGNQVQILNFADRARLVPVGTPRPIKQEAASW